MDKTKFKAGDRVVIKGRIIEIHKDGVSPSSWLCLVKSDSPKHDMIPVFGDEIELLDEDDLK